MSSLTSAFSMVTVMLSPRIVGVMMSSMPDWTCSMSVRKIRSDESGCVLKYVSRPMEISACSPSLAITRGAARIRKMVEWSGDADPDDSVAKTQDRGSSMVDQLERWLINVRGGAQ